MRKVEEKKLKAYFSKSGAGSYSPRVNFPKTWFDKIGITMDEREITITLNENTQEITIKKAK